jgi:hypothetical protein
MKVKGKRSKETDEAGTFEGVNRLSGEKIEDR